ncbi:MAG: glycosyltransferase family 87 protein [Aulosira sp. ZfuVER01]|nr:glycosyltransferase family 87 protein [Aulosira sp. ZfuVER01]
MQHLNYSVAWKNRFSSLLLIVFIVLVTLWRIRYKFPQLRDFYEAYYPAGRLIIDRPEQIYEFIKSSDGIVQPVIYGFVNLPIIAYLLTPFSVVDQQTSGILFTLFGVVAIVYSGWLLIESANLKGWKKNIFIALLAINAPIFNSIWLGNSTHIIFVLLIAAFISFRSKQDLWSGFFLAIAGLIKIPLLFLILYFCLKRRWQVVAGFVGTIIAVVSLSILVCGLDLNVTWFQKCILSFTGQAVAGDTVQSVDAFLIRLLTNAPIDSYDYVDGGLLFKLLRYGIFSLLMGGTLLACWRSRHITSTQVENLEFSSFLCLTLLISPISWTHYYLFLLLPIALYLGGQLSIPSGWRWSALMTLSILLVIAPNVRNIPTAHPVIVALTRHILVSHYFWGGVLLLGVLLTSLFRYREIAKTREPSLLPDV